MNEGGTPVILYSTCADCGEIMQVIHEGQQRVHPLCQPPAPTEDELLMQRWLRAAEVGDTALEAQLKQQLDRLDEKPPRLLEAALWYARWGWPVFPIVNGQKRPATRNGFKDATTDEEQIRAWWEQWPGSNIGLATGHLFDVIDVDVPEGVRTYLQMLEDDQLHVHGHVITASGGHHLYIKPEQDSGNKGRCIPGVDFRGLGGYVVAPPSTLGPRWRSWTWFTKPSPAITSGSEVPA